MHVSGIASYGLMFTKSEMVDCTGYSDADWAGYVND